MSRFTRLYALCVLVLLAYDPQRVQARLERVPRGDGRHVRIDRRQEGGAFGGIFGGGQGLRPEASTAAAEPTAAATVPMATAAAAGTTAAALPASSAPAASTPVLAPPSRSATSTPALNIPILGGLTSSTPTTSAMGASNLATAGSASVPALSTLPDASSDTVAKDKSSATQVIVTITSIMTNADGSHSTMLSQSASAVAGKQNDSSGPSGKTWGIIGGVVGGVAVLLGAILVLWRCTQRRFDTLDGDVDEIKWPELQPDGQTVSAGLSTLNPASTRRTGRAGIEMEKDEGSERSEDSPPLGARHDANETQYFDSSYDGDYSGHTIVTDSPHHGSYYDPYHDQAYPPPPNFGYPTSSSSPYHHYDGAISNASFRGSTEHLPLTGHAVQPSFDHTGPLPVLRVSSPTSSHRM
ncbi:uncharacterized protein JCM15063_000534 [Sporobolomyces koalae]|uniref:uncharacterized protein n=1 Tax=Sporobolomyces koalae TaxID=500713 RepID=UPI00316C64D0